MCLGQKPTSIKNTINGIVERVHQVFGDMVGTHDLKQCTFDDVNPWGPVLNDITWEIQSTCHTTTKASPGQLVFGRDILFGIPFIADWDKIAENKQIIINKSNQAESKNHFENDYVITNRVLIY